MKNAPSALTVGCSYCKARPGQQCHKPDSLKGMGERVHTPRQRLAESIGKAPASKATRPMTIVASDGVDTFYVKLDATDTEHALALMAQVIAQPVTVHGIFAGTLKCLLEKDTEGVARYKETA